MHGPSVTWPQPVGFSDAFRRFLLATTMLSGLATPALAQTLPSGGRYVVGAGAIGTAGAAMTVGQSSDRGIIDWQGFSIGAANKVAFENGSGATLNRVTGGNLSSIAGQLSATGSVYLVNPNGVVVGPGGQVLTGGSFVASTRDVPNDQFMAGGTLTFSGSSNGTVSNAGSITAKNGDVVLIGAAASNSGAISAPNGTAALAAGKQVLLAPAGGPAGIYVAPDTSAAGDASNSGTIRAAAAMLASAGGNVYALAGNRSGLIAATGAKTIAGQVWLTAPNGAVTVSGAVTAANADGSGGTIVADGHDVTVGTGALLSASGTRGGTVLVGIEPGGTNEAASTTVASGAQILATGAGNAGGHIETSGQALTLGAGTVDAGLGGSWVIDPVDLTIDSAAAGMIDASLDAGTSVTEETTATGASGAGSQASGLGDINVDAAITWNTSATLTLSAFHSVNVNAAITATGNGMLDVVTNNNTGGTSSGGSVNIAMGTGDVQFTTPGEGALNVNGAPFTLIWTMDELEAIDNNLGGSYALAANIDATGYTGFAPIGSLARPFTGTFSGLGNTISNLTIASSAEYVGPFGVVGHPGGGGVVRDIGLTGASITGTGTTAEAVGGLVGENYGTITNAFVAGVVTGIVSSGGAEVGGLAGSNSGAISGSYATGTVTGGQSRAYYWVGGLVGNNSGAITYSYADTNAGGSVQNGVSSYTGGLAGENYGSITNSYATGTASGAEYTGGLAGINAGTITDAYFNGSVNGGIGDDIGGLAGMNSGIITDTYATGSVSGIHTVGGLVGDNSYGSITNSHWSGTVTGGADAAVGGLTGANYGTITGSDANGTVTGGDNSSVGGLSGYNSGTITDSSATGRAIGGSDSDVGGLVGYNDTTGTIGGSSATGHESGGSGSNVGPLAGVNDGTITP